MIAWCLLSADPRGRLASIDDESLSGLLSATERVRWASLRTPKRRRDWLLGREALKSLCRTWLAARGADVPLSAIIVDSAPSGAPVVALTSGESLPVVVSLSHRDEVAVAGLCDEVNVSLGLDVELCEPRPEGFVDDFLTATEAAAVRETPDPWRAVTELWSAKESLLKALGLGLTVDTRTVEVEPRRSPGRGWTEIRVVHPAAPGARAFVRDHGRFVITLAVIGEGELPAPQDECAAAATHVGGDAHVNMAVGVPSFTATSPSPSPSPSTSTSNVGC